MAILEAAQLHKQYKLGGLPANALAGIDLAVQPSDFIAITGPSGSGKSTLLQVTRTPGSARPSWSACAARAMSCSGPSPW